MCWDLRPTQQDFSSLQTFSTPFHCIFHHLSPYNSLQKSVGNVCSSAHDLSRFVCTGLHRVHRFPGFSGTALSPELPDTPGKGRKPCNPQPYSKWRPQHNSRKRCFTLKNPLFSRIVSSCSCYIKTSSPKSSFLLHFCYTSLFHFVLFCFVFWSSHRTKDCLQTTLLYNVGDTLVGFLPYGLMIGHIYGLMSMWPMCHQTPNIKMLGFLEASGFSKMSCVFSQSGAAKMLRAALVHSLPLPCESHRGGNWVNKEVIWPTSTSCYMYHLPVKGWSNQFHDVAISLISCTSLYCHLTQISNPDVVNPTKMIKPRQSLF